jgi:hypothetical protein
MFAHKSCARATPIVAKKTSIDVIGGTVRNDSRVVPFEEPLIKTFPHSSRIRKSPAQAVFAHCL